MQRPNIEDFITEKTPLTRELYDYINTVNRYIDTLENQIENTQTLQSANESKEQSTQIFVAVFRMGYSLGPEDWEVAPQTKLCNEQTTIGEILNWYKSKLPYAKFYIEITEAE